MIEATLLAALLIEKRSNLMIQSTRGNYHESKDNCASNLNSARQLEESVLNPRILGECSIALAATCAKGNADLRVSFLADVSLAKCKMET